MNRVFSCGLRRSAGVFRFPSANASFSRNRSSASVGAEKLESDKKTHFGFETVTEEEKEERGNAIIAHVM